MGDIMRILLSYFSRTGSTERLAQSIGVELQSRGHTLEWEAIKPALYYSWFHEVSRDFPRYLSIFTSLASSSWRRHHLETYNQVEEDIQPLRFPSVSGFDRICIGGPKWAQISYPVARYLQTVRGIRGKRVGSFFTFGGPPMPIFEIELYEKPIERFLRRMGVEIVASLGLSSAYHEASVMPLFRLASRRRFGRPIEDFTVGSEYGVNGIRKFCTDLLEAGSVKADLSGDLPSAPASAPTEPIPSTNKQEMSHAKIL
jgi:hypothetical protein